MIIKPLPGQFAWTPPETFPYGRSSHPSPEVALRAWSSGSIDGCPEKMLANRAALGSLRASFINDVHQPKALGNAIQCGHRTEGRHSRNGALLAATGFGENLKDVRGASQAPLIDQDRILPSRHPVRLDRVVVCLATDHFLEDCSHAVDNTFLPRKKQAKN